MDRVDLVKRQAKMLGASGEFMEFDAHCTLIVTTQSRVKEFGQIIEERLSQFANQVPDLSDIGLFHFFCDRQFQTYVDSYYVDLLQCWYSQESMEPLLMKMNGNLKKAKGTSKAEIKVIEQNQSLVPEFHRFSNDELQSIALIQELAYLDPHSQEGKQRLEGLMKKPQFPDQMKFLSFLFIGIVSSSLAFSEETEKKFGYSSKVGIVIRKALDNVFQYGNGIYKIYLERTFRTSPEGQEVEIYPQDSVIGLLMAAKFGLDLRYYIISGNLVQLMRGGFIPGIPDEVVEEIIRQHQQGYQKYAKIQDTKVDSLRKRPYQILVRSYANGTDSVFYDRLEELHKDDEDVDLGAVVQPLLADGKEDTSRTRFQVLNSKLQKRVETILPEDDFIAQIDVTAVADNFIDIIVFSYDDVHQGGAAFALQIDEEGRILGIPQPCTADTAKTVGYIFKLVVKDLRGKGILPQPRQPKEKSTIMKTSGGGNSRRETSAVQAPPNQTTPNREERKILYAQLHADKASSASDPKNGKPKDDKTKLLESLGLNGSNPSEARVHKGFTLRFPAEAVHQIREDQPGLVVVVRKALESVKQDIKVSGISSRLEPIRTKDNQWRIDWDDKGYGNGRFRIFLEQNGGVLSVIRIEQREDDTYGRRFHNS